MRLIGIDPGLRHTGWGIIEMNGNRLTYVGCGAISPPVKLPMAERLRHIYDGLQTVLQDYIPDEAAVEETFLNKNPSSTLKLGHARGIALLAPAMFGLSVAEYSAKTVKQSVVGTGSATKDQVGMMVKRLLPGCTPSSEDAADALAIAICHGHRAGTERVWAQGIKM
jgi:crossover junction endodeoxyribonuclease RuvC